MRTFVEFNFSRGRNHENHGLFLLGKFATILIQQNIIYGSAKILCSANCPINHVEQ